MCSRRAREYLRKLLKISDQTTYNDPPTTSGKRYKCGLEISARGLAGKKSNACLLAAQMHKSATKSQRTKTRCRWEEGPLDLRFLRGGLDCRNNVCCCRATNTKLQTLIPKWQPVILVLLNFVAESELVSFSHPPHSKRSEKVGVRFLEGGRCLPFPTLHLVPRRRKINHAGSADVVCMYILYSLPT